MIPSAFMYLALMLAVICFWFMLLKRPVYESMFIAFIALVALTGSWSKLFTYFQAGLKTSLLYSMTVFVALSMLLTKTGIIDGAVNIILSLLGRITGGTGYAAVTASSFMGALSGSGPGNVMTTGTITIPAMKRAGFPPELAANIESTSSYLGNMIPPSANIMAALGAFTALYPEAEMTSGKFWVVCWGCSLWFIAQRLITVFAFCKVYNVRPMDEKDIPDFRTSLRKGWKGLLLPVIILAPFVLDFFLKTTFFTERLGKTGSGYFSSSMLFFIAGVAAFYTLLVSPVKLSSLADTFSDGAKNLSVTVGTCIFGYMIGALFKDLNISGELQEFLSSLKMGRLALAMYLPLILCFMGMIIPGSSIVVVFGSSVIAMFAQAGVSPVLAAAMLPCICGVMCGITPPLALGMYAGMSLAGSDFRKTVLNDIWWVILQYLMEVIILLGLLPVMGV
ncbi:MAG: TRAP transporter large permease subunit [Synergistaceae bacterium]|nr:TRAP transporter large permease subunit [Synergistaceae bacterium]